MMVLERSGCDTEKEGFIMKPIAEERGIHTMTSVGIRSMHSTFREGVTKMVIHFMYLNTEKIEIHQLSILRSIKIIRISLKPL